MAGSEKTGVPSIDPTSAIFFGDAMEDGLRRLRESVNFDLAPLVPVAVRRDFDRLRTLHAYGLSEYNFFTAAHDLCFLMLEQALGARFLQACSEGPVVEVRPTVRHVL